MQKAPDKVELPQGATSNWVTKESTLEGDCTNRFKSLKLPSGKSFRVIVITGEDNNEYSVIEVSEWVAIAADVIKQTGKNELTKQSIWAVSHQRNCFRYCKQGTYISALHHLFP
jgi:hypothetical protein